MIGKLWKIHLQKIAVGCMIGIMILLSACGGERRPKVTDEESALAMLQSMEGYDAQVNVVFFSNRGENAYQVHQRVKSSGEYRLEIMEPQNLAGILTISDGKRTVQSDPTIEGWVEARPTPVRDALLLYSFIEAYQQNGGETLNGDEDTLLLCAQYPGEHRKIVSAQLRLAKGTGLPLSLVINDQNGDPSLHITYLQFQMNPEFEEEMFQIPS